MAGRLCQGPLILDANLLCGVDLVWQWYHSKAFSYLDSSGGPSCSHIRAGSFHRWWRELANTLAISSFHRIGPYIYRLDFSKNCKAFFAHHFWSDLSRLNPQPSLATSESLWSYRNCTLNNLCNTMTVHDSFSIHWLLYAFAWRFGDHSWSLWTKNHISALFHRILVLWKLYWPHWTSI